MYELMGKLQIRDLHKKGMEKELQKEEYTYDQIVSNLSKVKQERRLQGLQNAKEKKDKMKELEECQFTLTAAQNEKEHELQKLKDIDIEQRELEEEAAILEKEIMTLEKSTAADSEMIATLEGEIERLEQENKEKEAELLAQQSRNRTHLSSVVSDVSGKKEAPDVANFRSSLEISARGSNTRQSSKHDDMMNEISKAKMDLSNSQRHMLETRFSQDGLAFQRQSSNTNDLKSGRTSQEGSQYGSAQTEDMISQDNFSFHSLDLN